MNALKQVQGRSIRTEVILICVLSILIVAALTGTIAYQLLKEQQQQQTLQTQHTIANQRASQIEAYMDNQIQNLIQSSQSIETVAALGQLGLVFQQGPDSQAYEQTDEKYRQWFISMLQRWDYYDIFLINVEGDIVFSVTHENDFATNLRTGPYHDSGLAHVYRDALRMLSPDHSSFTYYEPSDEPAAFIAAPVFHEGKLLGALAFQLNTDTFYSIAGNLDGLGSSGEIILGTDIGDSVVITAPTRHEPDAAFKHSIPRTSALARPIREATQGIIGQGILSDLRGIEVIAAWVYLPSLNWGLVAKIDQDEALEGLALIRDKLILSVIVILLLMIGFVAWRANHIIQPLSRLTQAATSIAKGRRFYIDTPTDTPIAEINLLSASFNNMSDEILSYQRELEDKVKARTAELSRLQAAVEQTHEVVLITNRDAIIQYVNPAFEKISGYTAKEAVGRRANMVKSGEMSKQFYEQMWNTILAGGNWQADFINRNKAGELYEVEQAISPIKNEEGNIAGFVSVQRDVTQERQQQQQLEHTQRLESLGVLAGGIAHDFNNLLTAILGNAGIARRRMPDDNPVAINLKHIEDASERAADLCKQMLAYSGKGKFVVVPINLSSLIDEILGLLNISINKNVSLRTDLDTQIPAIEADKAQMQQIIMNLVINASEAIGEDSGNIVMHTGIIDVDENYLQTTYVNESLPGGQYVFMEISDDGCGMDSDTLNKLYDPFFTTKFTGRGLGMSAILGIVRGHKGAIKVYSEVDKGTTFKVLFPAIDMAQRENESSENSKTEAWQGYGRILVVDDEASLRQTARLMLEDIGFDVMTAVDGVDGVELFAREYAQIDAVLLDMTMPNMDGKTAFQEMRKIDPEAKVILSSGYNEQEATSHFAGKGLAGFIQKPYQLGHLRQKLFEILVG
ncbi:PAS domain S-box protein [Mariprofundus sp. EBB-1]|uniref:hybrid sensor histidine kinase/response regulator n=1 Tax=Mariprofundus sp. EBB-1 TaxID=2650971 RepID=UPI000EF279E9|nr:PAS domain S-box protein [Mariprofundus sp. EBB-1]RLL54062.1 PAS domain S-box protein [Mariprofundus sp. EBB-1]